MAVILKCPECETKFKWRFNNESAWPSHCPHCKGYMGIDRADDDIVMPAFLSARTKANDKVYKDMEKGSEVRAQAAADLAGVPVADMSGLKITNLNDRKDSEIAAMPVQNAVTQHMDAMNQRGGQFGFQQNGSAWASQVSQGRYPNAGAKTIQRVQKLTHGF